MTARERAVEAIDDAEGCPLATGDLVADGVDEARVCTGARTLAALEAAGLRVVEETATRRADAPWRVGRKLGRTLYEQRFLDGPDDTDRFLGIMDDPAVAARVVELHNAAPGTRSVPA